MAWTRKEKHLHSAFLLTTLGDRMWTFVVGLFMHQLGGMTWVAVQQLVESVLKLTFITIAGNFLDQISRNKIIQRSLLINNSAVAVSAAIFAYMFIVEPENYSLLFLITAAASAAVSKVASEIQRISFTKDWVVVIARAENVDLSRINSHLMVIDQVSCAILPLIVGRLLDVFRAQYVCIMIIAYNCLSWTLESWILNRLYRETTELKTRASEIEGDSELRGLKDVKLNSIRMYFKQDSWTAGFGLSLLYMTVLGFDNLAQSYGQKHGLSAGYIGFLRGFGSLLGIFGAWSFHFVAKKVGLLWTVMIGLLWQNIFINMCGVSVMLPGSSMDVRHFAETTNFTTWHRAVFEKVTHPEPQDVPAVNFYEVSFPVTLFFMGIMFARFGLWLADPAITQIQQETIPENQRYMVFSVQSGLADFFSILKDIIVILMPFTPLFGLLTLGSCAFVFSGFVFNVFYHAQCGFSLNNKNMHLKGHEATEMAALPAAPERQSLIGEGETTKNSPEKETNGKTIID